MASYGFHSPCAARTGCMSWSDFPHMVQFHFSKEGMDHILHNQSRSTPGGLVRVWSNASGLEASWCAGIIRPSFWLGATSKLPVSQSDSVAFFDRCPGSYCAKPAWSDLVPADSGFGQMGLVQKQACVVQKQACVQESHLWPLLLSWSGSDANRIRHVYWGRTVGKELHLVMCMLVILDLYTCRCLVYWKVIYTFLIPNNLYTLFIIYK